MCHDKRMKHLLALTDWVKDDLEAVFDLADRLKNLDTEPLKGKSIALFIPQESVFWRSMAEHAIDKLGAHAIILDAMALERNEDPRDFTGLLANFASAMMIRHENLPIVRTLAAESPMPVIVTMSDRNNPTEVLSDIYQIRKRRPDWQKLNYVFVGPDGAHARGWLEASRVFGLNLRQCCPRGFQTSGSLFWQDLPKAIKSADVVITRSAPPRHRAEFVPFRVTYELMESARDGAMLLPIPTFTRGDEVSEDALEGPWYPGSDFKASMLEIQMAIILVCMGYVELPPRRSRQKWAIAAAREKAKAKQIEQRYDSSDDAE